MAFLFSAEQLGIRKYLPASNFHWKLIDEYADNGLAITYRFRSCDLCGSWLRPGWLVKHSSTKKS
jgi:hypothetical protein